MVEGGAAPLRRREGTSRRPRSPPSLQRFWYRELRLVVHLPPERTEIPENPRCGLAQRAYPAAKGKAGGKLSSRKPFRQISGSELLRRLAEVGYEPGVVQTSFLRSAVDHSLRALGVPSPLHRDLGRGAIDVAEIALGELDGGRRDVLLQAMLLRGARYRHDPGLLGEEPSERDLGGRRALALSDAAEQIDQRPVRLPGLRGEAGDGVAEVGAVERGVLVDLAREEALAQRAEGNETNSQLLQGRDDLRLGFSPPKRVFALQGGDGLDGVRAADGLHACL